MRINRAIGLTMAAGLAASANAQDSVSRAAGGAQGLPGDALTYDSTDGQSQVAAYRVDLVPMFGSWGTFFGMAPIAKSPKSTDQFFNNLTSAWGMSQDQLNKAAFPQAGYWSWDQPGLGIHPTENAGAGVLEDPSNGGTVNSTQMAAIFADFGGITNNSTTAIINYDPDFPARLYITRVNTSTNVLPGEDGDSSQIGVGGIDANGNAYLRADGFGVAGPDALTGDNYYHIDTLGRDGTTTNVLSDSGSNLDATTRLLTNSATTHSTPTAFPESIAGSPNIAGANFDDQWVRGFNSLTSDGTHFNNGITDVRGSLYLSPISLMNGSVATGVMLGKSAGGATDSFNMFDIDAGGSVLRTSGFTPPVAVSDPVDAYTVDTSDDLFGEWRFEHYRSQVAFRGGNGQVAVGTTSDGLGVAASTAYLIDGLGTIDPFNALVVAHFDPDDPEGTATWVLAAWIDFFDPDFRGKPIKDGPGGDVIGNLVTLDQVTGGNPLGPSMSAPTIDSAGNIWFVSAVALDKIDQNGDPFVDFDSALIRAVYDPASGGYELERIIEQGFVRQGLNSCTDYQIQFIGIADSNSVSSGTLFSSGINPGSWNNVDTTGLDNADPRHLGGIMLAVDITYDVDGDGDFEDPTSGGGNPDSGDESYQTLLYIGNIDEGFGFCPADIDANGVLDSEDFFGFLDQFVAGACAADRTFDGGIDSEDFFDFLDDFVAGCQ